MAATRSVSLGKNLLLVDDDQELLSLVAEEVRELGYNTVEVTGGNEALAKILDGGFDAVLCDVAMPGMDGVSLLRHVRAEGCLIPFVLFTGNHDFEVLRDAIRLDAFDFLRKPCDRDDLHSTVHRMLEVGAKMKANQDNIMTVKASSSEAKEALDKVDKVTLSVIKLKVMSVPKRKVG